VTDGHRSFWSSIPGLITGLAGLLTAVVGLGTLAVQQGIIGKGSSSGPTTTVAGAGAVTGAGGPTTTEAPAFTVSPTLLKLQATQRDTSLTVTSSTRTATVTMLTPQFSGTDAASFKVDAGCTNVRLDPERSCTLKVLFSPSGLPRTYSATLVLRADGAPPTEVPIQATGLL